MRATNAKEKKCLKALSVNGDQLLLLKRSTTSCTHYYLEYAQRYLGTMIKSIKIAFDEWYKLFARKSIGRDTNDG